MFSNLKFVEKKEAIFNLAWTYNVKVADGSKKARCACDGSPRGGQMRILNYTYANSVDHTSSRISYAAAAAENLVIFGADVSNVFAEARHRSKASTSVQINRSASGGHTRDVRLSRLVM